MNHLKATREGRMFNVQGSRAELLQLAAAITLIVAEEEATDTHYERAASIGEGGGVCIGVWEIVEDAPTGFTAPALRTSPEPS